MPITKRQKRHVGKPKKPSERVLCARTQATLEDMDVKDAETSFAKELRGYLKRRSG